MQYYGNKEKSIGMDFNVYYKEVLDHIHSGVLYCKNDPYSTIIYANDYFYKMIGYTAKEIKDNFDNRFADLVVDDVSAILIAIDEKISKKEDLDFEFRLRKKNGEIFWVHDTAKYDRDNNCWYVTIMDITEMKSLDYERERLEFYLNSIPNKIVISNAQGEIIYKNKRAQNCDYYNQEAKTFKELIGSHVLGQSYDDIFNAVIHGQTINYETRFRSQFEFIGHDKNYLIPITTKDKKGVNYMQVSKNLLKYSDSLTLFPTRLMFEYYYKKYFQINQNKDGYLCIVDLDDFKAINDNYGHNVGDEVICATASRIVLLLEREDYVCRYGGDEFVILFLNCDKEKVVQKIERLLKMSKKTLVLKGNKICLGYSVGVTAVDNTIDFNQAFQKADQALYEVKQNGKNQVMFFKN